MILAINKYILAYTVMHKQFVNVHTPLHLCLSLVVVNLVVNFLLFSTTCR